MSTSPTRGRVVGLVGFTASVAIHALVFGVRFHVALPARTGVPLSLRLVAGPGTMRAVRIAMPIDRPAERQSPAPETRALDAVEPVRADLVVSDPADLPARATRRFTTRLTDTRLFTPPADTPATLSAADEAERALADAIGTIADSMTAENERKYDATHWTAATAGGTRFEATPTLLRLGVVTIPLKACTGDPCEGEFLAPPLGRRDELRHRIEAWGLIRPQAGRVSLDSTLADRLRAMRRRTMAR